MKFLHEYAAVIKFTCIGFIVLFGCLYIIQAKSNLLDKQAPLFSSQAVFPDGSIDIFHLKDYIGKNIVIYFYPMDASPGCTKQAKIFRDQIAKLQDKGIMVVGISADSIESHQKFQKKLGLPYPLISDSERNDSIAKKYKATGFLIGKRITFLINQQGIIFEIFDKVSIQNQIDDILNSFEKEMNKIAKTK